MITIWLQEAGGTWFGVAEHGCRLVATVVAPTRTEAERSIRSCLPAGVPFQDASEHREFAEQTIRMLARLEQGDEKGKRFELSSEYVSDALGRVLRVAACIPIGFVSTYGAVAAASGTVARAVGQVMSTNPLYPIVPCHRVVGSDLSLVGYGGSRRVEALRAKLERLREETRGFDSERVIEVGAGLRVLPVEWVIARAEGREAAGTRQLSLW